MAIMRMTITLRSSQGQFIKQLVTWFKVEPGHNLEIDQVSKLCLTLDQVTIMGLTLDQVRGGLTPSKALSKYVYCLYRGYFLILYTEFA